jgi:hypothetical protein
VRSTGGVPQARSEKPSSARPRFTLTLKDGKATLTLGTETQTLDDKVKGNKLTLLSPKEGGAVFTINDDGTLNSQLASFQKSATRCHQKRCRGPRRAGKNSAYPETGSLLKGARHASDLGDRRRHSCRHDLWLNQGRAASG